MARLRQLRAEPVEHFRDLSTEPLKSRKKRLSLVDPTHIPRPQTPDPLPAPVEEIPADADHLAPGPSQPLAPAVVVIPPLNLEGVVRSQLFAQRSCEYQRSLSAPSTPEDFLKPKEHPKVSKRKLRRRVCPAPIEVRGESFLDEGISDEARSPASSLPPMDFQLPHCFAIQETDWPREALTAPTTPLDYRQGREGPSATTLDQPPRVPRPLKQAYTFVVRRRRTTPSTGDLFGDRNWAA
eukprot:GGOE01011775.1.p1 GENE.GGOE01011775.1~~GGOE01011775.1.p1  ORF type:complete len:254 (-),score=56.85 GGOE01011775.1:1897-2613(-)